QNAEVASLVSQIHTHGEPLSVGAGHTFRLPSHLLRFCRSRFEFLAQLCHQFCHHLFGIPLDRTRLPRLAGSLCVRLTLAVPFHESISLYFCRHPHECTEHPEGNATEVDLLISSSYSPALWSSIIPIKRPCAEQGPLCNGFPRLPNRWRDMS